MVMDRRAPEATSDAPTLRLLNVGEAISLGHSAGAIRLDVR